MRKVALVFLLIVFVPSLALAWLALDSVRKQQLVLEREQSLLMQRAADDLARQVREYVLMRQEDLTQRIQGLLPPERPVTEMAFTFDAGIRAGFSLAEVGFMVSLDGPMLAPSPLGEAARQFHLDNDQFLCAGKVIEVYWNGPKGAVNLSQLEPENGPSKIKGERSEKALPGEKLPGKSPPTEAEFHRIVGDAMEGSFARFLQDKLKLFFWCRTERDPKIIFGVQISMARLKDRLKNLIRISPPLQSEVCAALLDDAGNPLALTRPGFRPMVPRDGAPGGLAADWRHPFASAEIGDILPHWIIAVYPLNPAKLGDSARLLVITLSCLVGMLMLAIGVGGWLVFRDVNRQLALTRQKTDFVSNVSHELKTPLTSIRLFLELLAEGKVADAAKQRAYLRIINAECGRLTRLINNVLDFSRLERGEKKYVFRECDLTQLTADTLAIYRPHLESLGFELEFHAPPTPVKVSGDPDALAQILVNLLSNAEKYCGEQKQIIVELSRPAGLPDLVELSVSDRGLGVPVGCAEKIFEQFYRAHDALNSGISGSGLGLTLARQIARAHGGDVVYAPRVGGGSCFTLRLPAQLTA